MRARIKLIISFTTFVVLFLSAFSGQLMAQIVAFDLTSGSAATAGIAANYPGQGKIMNISGITQSGGFSLTNGQTCYGWNSVGNDAWVTSTFSTAGYIKLSGSFQMKANTTYGPRDFKVQYTVDGTNWFDTSTGSTVVLTSSMTTYNFTLPTICENKTTVQVRWVQNSIYQLNDQSPIGTGSTNNASLKGVSIAGDAFAAPSTQASNISIVSVTPTTIKITTTNGNGNNRIILVNNVNSFTDPVNDYYPTPNTIYATGIGEQVIYNGGGSSVTVTVPSSKDVFWFRVYEFNKMDNLTRYKVETASDNPKLCRLEDIHTPTVTSMRLTRANLGATIATPTTGSVVERGIFWSLTSPVDETANMISESSNQGGVYSLADIDVDRGSTIYFKGYVTNESGTIMSEEGSFTNIPIFSGTGNWETAARWNVQEIPGAMGDATYGSVADNPVINGVCTLTADNNVTNLTINATRQLTISKGTSLKVIGNLTNNGGNAGVLIKSIDIASDNSANGSLIFANGTVSATVEMFSKASWNLLNPAGSRYTWQYFGIPVSTLSYSNSFGNCYVREWDESVIDYYDVWVRKNNGTSLQLAAGSTLTQGLGYELVQQSNHKYSFAGNLVHSDFSMILPYSSGARFAGQSVLSNPYAAAMDIAQLQFGANTEAAVYLYNTGTFADWSNSSGEFVNGSGPGTYTVSTPGSVGLPGIPTQIPSMQGFLVKATASTGSVSFAYANLLKNTSKQRVKSTTAKIGTMIDLIGTNYGDRMWILDDENCSDGFDNGYDGRKISGSSDVSQLYGVGNNEMYQIMAVNDMNNAEIAIQPGTETNFKLRFTHLNIENKYSALYLVDMVENKTVNITLSGTEYVFTANPTNMINRFKIISGTTFLSGVGLKQLLVNNQNGQLSFTNLTGMSGSILVYDTMGRLMFSQPILSNQSVLAQKTLSKGIYIIKSIIDNNTMTQNIVVR